MFVSFFPQLIAGPIVHHHEMMPQFKRQSVAIADNFSIGLTFLFIGLFKKVIIADSLAMHATPVFDAAGTGVTLTLLEAWTGALAYSLQLYFDFSGYSDMAIGIARLFGITLPVNFNSPYKATSIIDFWRRWHMTLSRFLRDYVYIPLGGNKRGAPRRYLNLGLTMLLGGLWHGAGWTFIIWGALHGAFLMINQLWKHLTGLGGRTDSEIRSRLTDGGHRSNTLKIEEFFTNAEQVQPGAFGMQPTADGIDQQLTETHEAQAQFRQRFPEYRRELEKIVGQVGSQDQRSGQPSAQPSAQSSGQPSGQPSDTDNRVPDAET